MREASLLQKLLRMKWILILCMIFSGSLSRAMSFGSAGGISESFEFGVGVTTAHQTDLNSWMSGTNQVGTQDLGSAYEFSVTYFHRLAGTFFELGLRPSYFMQSASGGGVSSTLNGYLLYPIIRIYPLENSFIHFFMEAGMGYGHMNGTVADSNASASTNFTASAFGALAGMGADFCFTDSQCMSVEGVVRYHPLARSIVSTASGTFTNTLTGAADHELEYSGLDVQNTFSGIIGQLAYTYKF